MKAFGVNAVVMPPGYASGPHFHERQEELYLVHRGEVEFTFGDGDAEEYHVLGPGGLARVDAATVRRFRNTSDSEEAVYSASAAPAATSAATAARSEARRPARQLDVDVVAGQLGEAEPPVDPCRGVGIRIEVGRNRRRAANARSSSHEDIAAPTPRWRRSARTATPAR